MQATKQLIRRWRHQAVLLAAGLGALFLAIWSVNQLLVPQADPSVPTGWKVVESPLRYTRSGRLEDVEIAEPVRDTLPADSGMEYMSQYVMNGRWSASGEVGHVPDERGRLKLALMSQRIALWLSEGSPGELLQTTSGTHHDRLMAFADGLPPRLRPTRLITTDHARVSIKVEDVSTRSEGPLFVRLQSSRVNTNVDHNPRRALVGSIRIPVETEDGESADIRAKLIYDMPDQTWVLARVDIGPEMGYHMFAEMEALSRLRSSGSSGGPDPSLGEERFDFVKLFPDAYITSDRGLVVVGDRR